MLVFAMLLFSYLEEYLFHFILACGFTRVFHRDALVRFLWIAPPFILISGFTEYFLGDSALLLPVVLLLLFLMPWFVLQLSFVHTLLLDALVYSTAMGMQVALVFLFSCMPFLNGAVMEPIIGLIGNLCTILLSLLIVRFLPVHRLYEYLSSRSYILLSALINLTGILIMMNLFSKLYRQDYQQLVTVTVIPLLLFLLLNAALIREFLQQKQREKELETFQSYEPVFREMIDQLRVRQHNFDNEIMTMKLLPTIHTDYESLSGALTDYAAYICDQAVDTALLRLNLHLLASFLYKKLHDAQAANRHVKLSVRTSVLQTVVPEYELIELVGILFDNMIEATPEETDCLLCIDSHDNKIEISTLNPGPQLTPKLRADFFTKGYSTKPAITGRRGYGLPILQERVRRYEGKIVLENRDSVTGERLVFVQIFV